jgi:hypothetical protein
MNSGYDASHVTHRRGIVSNADADDELGARSISYPPHFLLTTCFLSPLPKTSSSKSSFRNKISKNLKTIYQNGQSRYVLNQYYFIFLLFTPPS